MTKKRLTNDQIKDAAAVYGGKPGKMADALGCDRGTIRRRRDQDETGEIAAAMEEAGERISDIAEGNVIAAIQGGDLNASKWWLSRMAQDRGYSMKVEVKPQRQVQLIICKDGPPPKRQDGVTRVVMPDNGRGGPVTRIYLPQKNSSSKNGNGKPEQDSNEPPPDTN